MSELLPQVADTFRIIKTEGMGPRVREDDGGVCVARLVKISDLNFKQPSTIVLAPPREFGF